MDIKKRRRRRVAILILVTLLTVGGLGGVILLQRYKREAETAYHRAEGLAAVEQKDYGKAVSNLFRYLERNPDDAEAQHAFAKATLQVPQGRNRHLFVALQALERATKLDPKNRDAAHELIELYRLVDANEQTLELANRLLTDDPGDAKAMGAKAIALSRLNKAPEGRDVALDAIRLSPDDYRLHLILLQVQRAVQTPSDDLRRYGLEQAEKHPDDPRFELVCGLAHALSGDLEAARGWVRKAASKKIEDAQLAADLVQVLDTLNLWGDSLRVLGEAANRPGGEGMKSELVRRLVENNEFEKAAQLVEGTDPSSKDAKLEQQVLRAMALQNLGKNAEMKAVLDGLRKRTDSPLAIVYADALSSVYDPELTLPARVEAVKKAIETVPDSPYLYAFLGDAYSSVGDNESALRSWQDAAALRAPWGNVRHLVARALLNANRPAEAVPYAEEALMRMPDSVATAVTLLRARAGSLGARPEDSPEKLLVLVDRVQQAAPGEPQSLLVRVEMLARQGKKQEAAAAAAPLLEGENRLDQPTLARLTEINREQDLGLDAQLQQRISTQLEGTPELALTRASEAAQRGDLRGGRSILEEGLAAAPEEGKLSWRLALAAYLDGTGDPAAAETWTKVADENPDDRRVQRMALRARATADDREFLRRVIDRLEKQMGADSIDVRIERARWLAGGKESDVTQAVTQLRSLIEAAPKRLEPRLMLADALVRLGRPQLAIQEFRSAEQAVPGNIDVWMGQARLFQMVREFPNAMRAIELVLSSPDATDAHRREAAVLLARQGDEEQAIKLLEGLTKDDGGTPEERLLLASLYARAGRTADVDRLLPPLLDQPTQQALAFAIEYYTSQGRSEQVTAVLAKLDAPTISSAARHRMRAEHALRSDDPAAAAREFAEATKASPKDADLWRSRVRLHLVQNQAQDAVTVAQEGLKNAPDDPALRSIVDGAQLVTRFTGDLWGKRLLLAMVEEPTFASAGAAALQTLAAADAATPQGAKDVATRLSEQAKEHAGFLPLQLLAGRKQLEAGDAEAAADIAGRASVAFPTAPEPPALHAEALANTGRWDEALGAASEWRRRTGGTTLGPDLIMAEAHLQMREPARALTQLQPHAADALANPRDNDQVATRLARAYAGLKRYEEAGKILLPQVGTPGPWRNMAMNLAANEVEDPAVASAWLTQATAGATDLSTRMNAAQAWWTLSQRLSDPSLASQAREVVEALAAEPEAPAEVWYMRGVMAEQSRDPAAATQAYQEALRRKPDLAPAANNLAMVLADNGSDTAEPLRLANAAVAAEPANAAFLDTLAYVQAKAGQTDAAIETARKAVSADPDTKLWYEHLAKILRDAGRADEADTVMNQYEGRKLRGR